MLMNIRLTVICICIASASAWTESTSNLPAAHAERLSELMKVCTASSALDISSVTERRDFLGRMCRHASFKTTNFVGNALLDKVDGTVYLFSITDRSPSCSQKGTIIEDKEVRIRYQSVLDFYRVSELLQQPKLVKSGSGAMTSFAVTTQFFHKGLPHRGAFLKAIISATGTITSIVFSPANGEVLFSEEDMSQKEAIEIAGRFLQGGRFSSRQAKVVNSGMMQKVVALPNGVFVESANQAEAPSPHKAIPCWEIPFEYHDGESVFNGSLWISVISKEVVGGMDGF